MLNYVIYFMEVNNMKLIYEVVEVGPGGLVDGNEVTMIVTPGQKVLVGKYTGTKVKLEEQEYTIVRQSDILAVIE